MMSKKIIYEDEYLKYYDGGKAIMVPNGKAKWHVKFLLNRGAFKWRLKDGKMWIKPHWIVRCLFLRAIKKGEFEYDDFVWDGKWLLDQEEGLIEEFEKARDEYTKNVIDEQILKGK